MKAVGRHRASHKSTGFDWHVLVLWMLGGVGTGSIILREINYGVMVEADGTWYISSARNLLEGEGLVLLNGSHFTSSPPLFSLVIAGVGAFNVDVVTAAAYVNAIAFGLTVLVTAIWLRSRVESRLLVLWAGCACVLSIPLAESAVYVISETLFILFVVLSLVTLDRFRNTCSWSSLVLAAVWTALAWLTRYIGVTVVVTAWLLILIQKGISAKQKRRYFVSYSIIAMTPICVWILRNYLISGLLSGRLVSDGFSPLSSLDTAQTIFMQWVFTNTGFEYLNTLSKEILDITIIRSPPITAILLKASILLVVAVGVGSGVVCLLRNGYLRNRKTLAVFGTFVSVYAFGLTILIFIADINLPDRYLVPMYIPMLVSAILILSDFSRSISPRWPVRSLLVVGGGLCVWLSVQMSATYNNIRKYLDTGARYSYTSKHQADSEVMKYIKSNPLNGLIYSTNPERTYLLTYDPEYPFYHELPAEINDNWHRRERWTNGDIADAYIVVFYTDMGVWPYEFGDLAELPGMEVVAVLEDGTILKRAIEVDSRDRKTILDIILEDSKFVVHSDFDVYINESENRLVYIQNECDDINTELSFFLHIDPTEKADLPEHRRQYTFDNLDFQYGRYGFRIGERCIIQRNLPDYDMTAIRTGQWIEGQGHLWEVEIRP